jgi:hypothetical protein
MAYFKSDAIIRQVLEVRAKEVRHERDKGREKDE